MIFLRLPDVQVIIFAFLSGLISGIGVILIFAWFQSVGGWHSWKK